MTYSLYVKEHKHTGCKKQFDENCNLIGVANKKVKEMLNVS